MYTVDTKFMFLKLKIWTFAYIEDKHRSKESTRLHEFLFVFLHKYLEKAAAGGKFCKIMVKCAIPTFEIQN